MAREDSEAVRELFEEFASNGKRAVRNELVEMHRGLAGTIAKDYANRGVEYDDLRQVALLGLVKSVERFDPKRGVPFGAFASRTINGEIKRYFRDRTWSVRPPRSAQELQISLRRARERLTHRLERPPTINELADEVNADPDDVLVAMEAHGAWQAASLDAPVTTREDAGMSVGDRVPDEEDGYEQTELSILVADLLTTLPEREAEIVQLRFVDELTQSEIAERVGISQMHVSRLLRRSLTQLRDRLSAARSAEASSAAEL